MFLHYSNATEKLFEYLETLVQEQQLTLANIKGFEKCPFCVYGVINIVEPEVNMLFNCENQDCKKQSCRLCKKLFHFEELCETKKLDLKHKIEEEMTDALIRTCPWCQRKIIIETDCPSVQCICGKGFCYICRRAAGTQHTMTCETIKSSFYPPKFNKDSVEKVLNKYKETLLVN